MLQRLILILILAILSATETHAQPTSQDCLGAIPICSSSITVPTPYPYSGNGNYLNEIFNGGGCYCTEANGVWFTFTVQVGGILRFSLNPTDPNNDYDWILFNMSNHTCAQLATLAGATGAMRKSNTWGTFGVNGSTGVSTPNGGIGNCNGPGTTGGPKWCSDLIVTAGQVYILYVSNWSNSTSGFTLDFSSSTAVIFDANPPQLSQINTGVPCAPFSSLTIDFNENILCDSTTIGDFALIGPSGAQHTITNVSSTACVAGAEFDNTFTINFTPAVTAIGQYQLLIVPTAGGVQDLCGNLDTLDTLSFYYAGAPEVQILSIEPECFGYCSGIMEANGSAGLAPYTYAWSNGLPADSLQLNVCAGTYIVTVTDSLGCTAKDTLILGQPSDMTLMFDTIFGVSCPGVLSCNGGAQVGVSGATPPYAFSWPDLNSNAANFSLCSGDHWVTVTDANGCIDSLKATIQIPNEIVTNASNDLTICISNPASLIAASTGGTPPYSYIWTRDSLNGAVVATSQASLVFPMVTTSYFVSSVDVNGCAGDTSEMVVFVRPSLDSDISEPDTICPYDVTSITASGIGGDSNYTYAWSTGSFGPTINVGPDLSTYYYVTISDACGTPTHIDSVFVQVGGYSDIIAKIFSIDDSLCAGQTTVLTATARGGHNGPLEYNYEWNDLNQTSSFLTIQPSKTKDYIVTITDLCLSKPGIDTIRIEVDNPVIPEIKITPSKVCDHSTVEFKLSNKPFSYHHYRWNMGDGTIYENVQDQAFTHFYNNLGCHDIEISLLSDFGCTDLDTIICGVQVLSKPTASFSLSPDNPTNINPIIEFINNSKDEKSVQWLINQTIVGNTEQFIYEFYSLDENNLDSFEIMLIAESYEGCFDTIVKTIPFIFETIFYIPNSFTPNGDGLNDEFKIYGEGIHYQRFELTIFDRWGNELFYTRNPDQAWDGRLKTGEYYPVGVYSYIIKYLDTENEPKVYRGEVTLSRPGIRKGL